MDSVLPEGRCPSLTSDVLIRGIIIGEDEDNGERGDGEARPPGEIDMSCEDPLLCAGLFDTGVGEDDDGDDGRSEGFLSEARFIGFFEVSPPFSALRARFFSFARLF